MGVEPHGLFKGLLWITLDWMGSRVLFNRSILTEAEASTLGEQGARLIHETMPRRDELYGPIPVANRPDVHVFFYLSVASHVAPEIDQDVMDAGLHNLFFVLYSPTRATERMDLVPFYREILFSQIKEWISQGPLSGARLESLYSQLATSFIFPQQKDVRLSPIDGTQQVLIQYVKHVNRLSTQHDQLKQRLEALQRAPPKESQLLGLFRKYAENDPTLSILVLLSDVGPMDVDALATTVGQNKLMFKRRLSKLVSLGFVTILGNKVQLCNNSNELKSK